MIVCPFKVQILHEMHSASKASSSTQIIPLLHEK
uniref:Uncharacterized protein n=1 Tax=Arundo donax TaxID=35708 RepID=A0A0A8Z6J8_ARUDO